VHIRPDEHRDIERHVVDPDADENSRSYAGFESSSTHLVYSQESTEQHTSLFCVTWRYLVRVCAMLTVHSLYNIGTNCMEQSACTYS